MQEAFYIFQELCEKYTRTVMLMNGSAVCQMHMGQFEEAEARLLEALNKVQTACLDHRSREVTCLDEAMVLAVSYLPSVAYPDHRTYWGHHTWFCGF